MHRTFAGMTALVIAVGVMIVSGSTMLENHDSLWAGTAAAAGSETGAKEFQTKTGKTIIVSETHPVSQSLSTIEIYTKNFEHEFAEVYKDQDPISDIFLADLDGNGFDELYIITTSAGSGSYGKVIGLASNKDKSLSMVHFPPVESGDPNFKGYMGHDVFRLEGRKLVRLFPVYHEGDTNQNPTGGTRYGTVPVAKGFLSKAGPRSCLKWDRHVLLDKSPTDGPVSGFPWPASSTGLFWAIH